MGLLLLRLVVGVSACLHGGILGIATGVLFVLGLLTPITATVTAIAALGFGLYQGSAVVASLALLGPGAFSVDARLFGRREIIIPRRNNPTEV